MYGCCLPPHPTAVYQAVGRVGKLKCGHNKLGYLGKHYVCAEDNVFSKSKYLYFAFEFRRTF